MKKFSIILALAGLLVTAGIFYQLSSVTFKVLDNGSDALEVTSEENHATPEQDTNHNSIDDSAPPSSVSGLDLTRSSHSDAIIFRDGKEEEAKETILYLHDIMNDLTGYGFIESLNFESLNEGAYHDNIRVEEAMEKLKEDLLDESRALDDVRNFTYFYQLGVDTEDRMALRYAHRIIHDLDVYVNGDKGSDEREIWGVTEAFGSEEAILPLYDYLRNALQ